MGEYVHYMGHSVKIGTCENLYYTTYNDYLKAYKSGFLSQEKENSAPEEYLKPQNGFRYRFPFPDEKDVLYTGVDDPFRGYILKIPVTYISASEIVHQSYEHDIKVGENVHFTLSTLCPFNPSADVIDRDNVRGNYFFAEIRQQFLEIDEEKGKTLLKTLFKCPLCSAWYSFGNEEVEALRTYLSECEHEMKNNDVQVIREIIKGYDGAEI